MTPMLGRGEPVSKENTVGEDAIQGQVARMFRKADFQFLGRKFMHIM
jgi:hypothetical protein